MVSTEDEILLIAARLESEASRLRAQHNELTNEIRRTAKVGTKESNLAIADRLERDATLLRSKSRDILGALLRLSGTEPGIPDPIFMLPEARAQYVTAVADSVSLEVSELLRIMALVGSHELS